MHEELRTLLNAYLDGELHGQRLREMETHLESCSACQDELRQLHLVSEFLQAGSAPQAIPAERFISQLTLSLPRRPLHNRSSLPGSLAWWLIPAGLLGAWFFVQTVLTLTGVVTAAKLTGMLGQTASWLGSGQETIWFSTVISLFGRQATGPLPTLSLLNNTSLFAANLLSGFLWQAVIGLLYWAWLLFWWLRSSPRPAKMQNAME